MSSETEHYILAVDLGTTALKLALVSTRGTIVAWVTEPQQVTLLPEGGAEQDPEQWWSAIVRGAHRLLAESAVPVDRIVAVNSSVHWSGTVALDRSGRPLGNAIIWMDARGAPEVRDITGGPVRIEGYGVGKLLRWVRLTGGAPTHSGKDSIAHILYLKHRQPEVYRQTHLFLEPKDFLNQRLTGQAVASFDSITLHWVTDNRDPANVRYDDRLIRLSGIDREKLPPLVPAATVLGPLTPKAAGDLGLSQETRVVSGAPDVMAAAIGSGAVRDFEAHLCIGTSSWLTCHVPKKKTDLFHNMASLPAGLPGRYLLTNEQESAGVCLTWLKDNVVFARDELGTAEAPPNVYQAFDRVAEKVPPGSEGLIFTPWLNGERTPVDDSVVRGGFFNQSLETTRAHMVRAVLEGVALNSRWLLKYVEKFAGRRLDPIRMIGGGAKSALWCRIHADVLGRSIHQLRDPVLANARGAALQAAVALGELSVEDIPGCVPIMDTYEPDPANRALYDELFAQFLGLYKRTRAVSARLSRGARTGNKTIE